MKPYGLLIFLLSAVVSFPTTADAQDMLKAYADHQEVEVGELFTITFEIGTGKYQNLKLPNLRFFDIQSSGDSRQVTVVNGRMTMRISKVMTCAAQKTGIFTVGAASVKIGNETYKSKPFEIKVVKDKKTDDGRTTDDLIFIKPLVSRRTVYKGEPITVAYKLYFDAGKIDISNYELSEALNVNGFWLYELNVPYEQIQSRETVNGKLYTTFLFEVNPASGKRKALLIPQRSGKLTIDPINVKLLVAELSASGRRDWFGNPVYNKKYKRLNRKTPRITINVKEPPADGRPDNYAGLVGQFKLKSTIDRTSVKAGEPVTLTLNITGDGNLQALTAPEPTVSPELELYDPTVKENLYVSGSKLTGNKTIEYLIVPNRAGEYTIPPIEVSYFNPETEEYETIQSSAYDLKVAEGDGTTYRPSDGSGQADNLRNQPIRPLKESTDLQPRGQAPFFGSAGHIVGTGLPFTALLFLVIYRRRRDERAADVAGTRMKQAGKLARKHLKAAEKALRTNDSRRFHDEIANGLWGYVADKFRIPTAELNRRNTARILNENGIRQPQIDCFTALIDRCEFARFAPGGTDDTALNDLYKEAADLIGNIETQLKQKS